MPYRICKIFEVESGHQLSKHPGACRFPHGHSRQVEVIIEADELDSEDMVCDFKALKNLLFDFINQFDHSLCLNSEDPNLAVWKEKYPERILIFAREDPTTEVMARKIYHEIRERLDQALTQNSGENPYPLRQKVRLTKVRVTETRTSWAEYYE